MAKQQAPQKSAPPFKKQAPMPNKPMKSGGGGKRGC